MMFVAPELPVPSRFNLKNVVGGVGHLRTRGCHTANKMFAFLHRYLPHTASWRGHLWQNYSAKVV